MCLRPFHHMPRVADLTDDHKIVAVTEHHGKISCIITSSEKAHIKGYTSKTKQLALNIDGATRYDYDGNVVLMLGARGSNHVNQPAPAKNQRNGVVFILDSGASIHLSGDFAIFASLWGVPPGRSVRTANGQCLAIVGCGSIILDGFKLRDVMFVPGLNHNLVSVSKLTEQDYAVEFRGTQCFIKDVRSSTEGAQLVGKGRRTGGGLYELDYLDVDRSPMA